MRCTKATSKRSRGLSRQRRRRATRYPFTRRVERISENFPPPVLEHVLESLTRAVHRFHCETRVPYLNYHRTGLFAHVGTDAKGKKREADRPAHIRTPCRVPKALPEAERCLCPKCVWQPSAPSELRSNHGNHP